MYKCQLLNEIAGSFRQTRTYSSRSKRVSDGKVTSDARIKASLPTIEYALAAGANVMVMSHLGRPTEGQYEDKYSLKPVANYLSDVLPCNVRLEDDYLSGVDAQPGELVILENVRFNKGEKADDETLSNDMRPCVTCLSWMHLAQPIEHKHQLMA